MAVFTGSAPARRAHTKARLLFALQRGRDVFSLLAVMPVCLLTTLSVGGKEWARTKGTHARTHVGKGAQGRG